jgi:acetyl-CoA carboxylase biotin carboxylase subunit
MKPYKKVLVANRGEIAVRIIRALKELGIGTVAVYSEIDKDSPHTRLADEKVCIGRSAGIDSYLNTYNLMSIATKYQVDAVHPGIGFMAESGDFSEICKNCDLDFIGPDKHLMDLLGNKSRAKQVAQECNIPIIKGSDGPVHSLDESLKIIEDIGYPVLLKATHGGGGKGIRLVRSSDELRNNYDLCIKEAKAAFNNGDLLIEPAIQNFRHVEVQILGDKFGNIIHLGDRECTIQSSNQKVIEEARCVNIDEVTRNKLYKDAIKISKYLHYVGPGTVEFVVLPTGEYYFLEMNTRLQVEHTITEMITGIDIVKEQINIFQGKKIEIKQEEIVFDGYALECRILAVDMKKGGAPAFGKIQECNMPGGFDVRVEYGYSRGNEVSIYYDSLLEKVCCKAREKRQAINKMLVALEELEIEGIHTNIDFLKFLLKKDDFRNGNYTQEYMKAVIDEYTSEPEK